MLFFIFIHILIEHFVSKQRISWSDAAECLIWVCAVCPTKLAWNTVSLYNGNHDCSRRQILWYNYWFSGKMGLHISCESPASRWFTWYIKSLLVSQNGNKNVVCCKYFWLGLNPFNMPNVFSHPYQLEESSCWVVFFIFIHILKESSVRSKQSRTWSDVAFVTSDLVLHCLPMSHKKGAKLIWVKH